MFSANPPPEKRVPIAKQKFGTLKQENFINKLIEHAGNLGYQRSNRYIVMIHGPGIEYLKQEDSTVAESSGGVNSMLNLSWSGLNQENKKRLALNCCSATLVGKGLLTNDFTAIGSGPSSKMPYAESYSGQISLEFNCGVDFFERKYFLGWNQKIVNPLTHDVELYENYAKKWRIVVIMLPADVGSFDRIGRAFADTRDESYQIMGEGIDKSDNKSNNHQLYFTRLCECYPVEIIDTPVSYSENNEIMKTTVKFNFKYFEDPVSVYQETIKRYKDLNGAIEIPLSPWDQFRKIFKDVSRYADPAELKQLVVDYGLSELNDVFGIENVESMASGGQIIDVFRRTPNKDYTTVINKLLGPLGGLL